MMGSVVGRKRTNAHAHVSLVFDDQESSTTICPLRWFGASHDFEL